jgi:hypothetical protein
VLTLYPVPGKEKSSIICRAFLAGAPRAAEGCVFFGTEGVMGPFQRAKASGHPWYYVDNAYFDKHRGIYFRVTRNALQVDPRGKTSNGKRFEKLQVPIHPWRTVALGEDTLVVPQSDNFMKSTLGMTIDWGADTVAKLHGWGVPNVRIRHWQRDKLRAAGELRNDLPNLRLLVTYSSASAITAMLEGVPAISESGAAHWLTGPLTREAVFDPPRPDDRVAFAMVLADNQFTLEEFRSGEAWAWLATNP